MNKVEAEKKLVEYSQRLFSNISTLENTERANALYKELIDALCAEPAAPQAPISFKAFAKYCPFHDIADQISEGWPTGGEVDICRSSEFYLMAAHNDLLKFCKLDKCPCKSLFYECMANHSANASNMVKDDLSDRPDRAAFDIYFPDNGKGFNLKEAKLHPDLINGPSKKFRAVEVKL